MHSTISRRALASSIDGRNRTPWRGHTHPTPGDGFTIMELMVVLLVMGIVAAAATPSFFSSLQYHEIETAARRVVLDLEQARHSARVRSQTQSVTFTNATTYTLSSGVTSLKSSSGTYSVDLSQPPYDLDGVTLNLGGPSSVSFDGFGNASVSGTIVLQLGDQTRTVRIDNANGQIKFENP
jgi:prepilin-type N-terminal cleavage/methylation domain-containing protein